jgi:hypothetical protein
MRSVVHCDFPSSISTRVNGKDKPPARPFLVFTLATDSLPESNRRLDTKTKSKILNAGPDLNVW